MAGGDRESEEFEKSLARLARRRAIEVVGHVEEGGLGLRRGAKERMARLDIPGLANKLIESEFVVDEKRAAVAADLSDELKKEFGLNGLAVVLMGSSVHGGLLVRRVMNQVGGDFDYGIVLDRKGIDVKKFREIRNKMKDYVKNRLTQLSEKYEIAPVLERCVEMNPLFHWAWNVDDLAEVTVEFYRRERFYYDDQMFLYFFPSFPAEINQRNRALILEGFSKLAHSDRKKWEKLTSTFISEWAEIHRLADKHMVDAESGYRRTEYHLTDEVVKTSRKVMAKRMRELILATGKPIGEREK